MRLVVLAFSTGAFVAAAAPVRAFPVQQLGADEATTAIPADFASHRAGHAHRRAIIAHGRVKRFGCGKKVGAGLRTPC